MKNHEFFASAFANEIPAHQRVLDAIPADKLDFRTHERNRTAGDLAWQIACEFHNVANILENGDINDAGAPRPATKAEIMKHFEAGVEKVQAQLKSVGEERWNAMGKFIIAGNEVGQMPSSALGWLLHNDMIHHRGQISVYLRPMGAKVPSIYGPSGDTEM